MSRATQRVRGFQLLHFGPLLECADQCLWCLLMAMLSASAFVELSTVAMTERYFKPGPLCVRGLTCLNK